jgi:ubiquinone/menaquinone biosynthesis C-methylase UbiE
LSLLNNLMNETSLAAMAIERGARVLDVGSGLGQLTCAAARIVGRNGVVIGIERDDRQLEVARQKACDAKLEANVKFRHGDAMDLPLADNEWGSFDIVHARFLLEHVPDPRAVLSAMVRAARPGGRIILEDDDHDVLRLWPEPPGVYALWRAYIDSFVTLGNDPYVGRRLVSLLHEAGAEPLGNTWNFFGSCAGEETFPSFVENFIGVVAGARETVLDSTSLTPEAFDAAITAMRRWGERPDAAFWYCTFWAQGRRRET